MKNIILFSLILFSISCAFASKECQAKRKTAQNCMGVAIINLARCEKGGGDCVLDFLTQALVCDAGLPPYCEED